MFQKDTFFLNIPISRENRNFWPITIRFDVGHPVQIMISNYILWFIIVWLLDVSRKIIIMLIILM